MEGLTLADIDTYMADRRTRGEYKPALVKFANSGDLAEDFSKLFPGKKAASLRNSLNQNIEKLPEGTAKLITLLAGEGDASRVLVVNEVVYRAQQDASEDE